MTVSAQSSSYSINTATKERQHQVKSLIKECSKLDLPSTFSIPSHPGGTDEALTATDGLCIPVLQGESRPLVNLHMRRSVLHVSSQRLSVGVAHTSRLMY